MREILFKAKRADNGKWVEGDLVQNARTQDGYSALKPATIRSSEWFYPKEVDPKTVCQFTGLLDKNGKRIFEGDIIVIPEKYPFFSDGKPNYIGVVEWAYSQWQYILHLVNKDRRGIFEGINHGLNDEGFDDGEKTPFEIIGNIYDQTNAITNNN